ncbi:MAG: hypothetical protein OXG69_10810, partial [bacterium]|nr:hypothetical protein [bacterium]
GFTVAELEKQVARLSGTPKQRWQRVLDAVKAMQSGGNGGNGGGTTPAAPAITVTAGAAVTEGTAAGFTLSADPAPAADLAVTVTVGQSGGYVASRTGARAVTIAAGETQAAFTVATKGDEKDEPDGAVTAAVEAGTGYTAGAPARVAVNDDDATAVTLSAEAGDIAETGGRKLLTVTLGRALVAGETLGVPLVFGGAAALGGDYRLHAGLVPVGVSYANLESTDPATPPTVTFTGPSAAAAVLALKPDEDGANEGAGETVTVALGTLTATGMGGGAAGSGSVAFSILEPPPEVSIAAKTASVTEGADAAFTVTASRAPGADLTVKLTVSEADGSDMVAADDEGAATVIIPRGKTEAAFAVPTVNDTVDEPDGTMTATLAGDGEDGTLYSVAASPKDAASVSVADNDAAAAVTLTIHDQTVREGEMFEFLVELSAAPPHEVRAGWHTEPGSAKAGLDFEFASGALTFPPGTTRRTVTVFTIDDLHDEDPETFEVVLRNAQGAAIGRGTATGTIVNDDPMPAAWLARFGRTVAEQALDGIAGRMAAPRTPGAQGTVAGQALNLTPDSGNAANGAAAAADAATTPALDRQAALALAEVAQGFGANADSGPGSGPGQAFGPAGFGAATHGFGEAPSHPQSQTMTAREALLGSSFTATGAKDGSGGSLALWGRAAQSSFDGREGTFSLDGETTTAMLGADYARGKWLVGLALMQSEGEGGYRDTDVTPRPATQDCPATGDAKPERCRQAVRTGDGEVEASLTAAVPYAALQASERLKLWGAAGYGSGEVKLTTGMGQALSADIDWSMAAAGLRGDLLPPPAEGSGPALALT